MILDKAIQVATNEELQTLQELKEQAEQAEKSGDVLKILDNDSKTRELLDIITDRYVFSLNGNKALILQDVREILENITLDDVKTHESINNAKELITKLQELSGIEKRQYEEWELYFLIISHYLSDQQRAYYIFGFDLKEIDDLIMLKVSTFKEKQLETLPEAEQVRLTQMYYPLDKVNFLLTQIANDKDTYIDTTSEKDKKKGEEALIQIKIFINFEELDRQGIKTSQSITHFDQEIWNICANLIFQEHSTVTIDTIYLHMSDNRPKAEQKQKIIDSIKKMNVTRVYLDTTNENILYPAYELIKADFPLFESSIIEAKIRGQITTAIEIRSVPPLFLFALKRKQMSTLPSAVYNAPLKKIPENLMLEQYMRRRISRNGSKNNGKIILDTVYKQCNITQAYQRTRARQKIKELLDYYVELKWIKAYKMNNKEIELNPQKRKTDKSKSKKTSQKDKK